MGLRDDQMEKFGPYLLEAIILIVMEEVNILRTNAGLTPRTADQLLAAIGNKLETLEDYTWIDTEQLG